MDIHRRAATAGVRRVGDAAVPLRRGEGHRLARLRFHRLGGRRAQQHPPVRRRPPNREAGGYDEPALRGGSLLTLTGVNADHRLRRARRVAVAQIAAGVGGCKSAENRIAAAVPAWTRNGFPNARRIWWRTKANPSSSRAIASRSRVHLLAHAMNAALGNVGKTVVVPRRRTQLHDEGGDSAELAQALNAGEVETLVILGGNPAYTAPADLNWVASAEPRRRPSCGSATTKTKPLSRPNALRLAFAGWRITSNRGVTRGPAMARWCRFSR